MTTQFQSNLPNVQQEVCIELSQFQDGQVPQIITVTYQNRFPYNYRFYRVDENGNYCYRWMRVMGGVGGKRKKPTPPPIECCLEADQNGDLFADQNDSECLQPDQLCS